ncbi:NtaA/DmoA family FMN-dependent monooxygenase [Glaciihabitans sp. dw_435]|uniref:NtaA/DmoA family FMN-dependent monooxygenase n=1 Tax=Glaciihabitans sp. dw_435 TaxID=2720081 RepID=UPI001BD3D2C7|nr:NtaA/DmoA family FMN-dependent monooxygenase [Glaciihabitans sp. dw_435]
MRQARLVALVNPPTSQYAANWSNPLTRADWLRGSFYTDLGRLLERGRFDMVFLADALAVPEDADGEIATTLRTGGKGAIYLDPIVGLSHIAAVTTHLGLGATVSTTFQHPFSIARSLLSLDQLSGGRAAWNIVTSTTDAEARNHGLQAIPDRAARYDRADEVVQSVIDLWEGWEPDALRLDTAGRVFADPARVHRAPERNASIPHARGPLAIPRSPQNRPVLMQAGASPRGLEFAARWAEVVFATGGSPDVHRTHRAALRERCRQLGRDPESLLYLPAIQPVLGSTGADARRRLQSLEDALDADEALVALGRLLHSRPEELDPDAPAVPLIQAHRGATGSGGFERSMLHTAQTEDLTIRELAFRQALSQFNLQPVGTPAKVADELEKLLDSGAADGFVVMPALYLTSFEDVVDGLVPELQQRGRLREEYEHTTLRANLASP